VRRFLGHSASILNSRKEGTQVSTPLSPVASATPTVALTNYCSKIAVERFSADIAPMSFGRQDSANVLISERMIFSQLFRASTSLESSKHQAISIRLGRHLWVLTCLGSPVRLFSGGKIGQHQGWGWVHRVCNRTRETVRCSDQ
jgi:hypothetical protein